MRLEKKIGVILSGLALFGCAALSSKYNVPARHPEELPRGRPLCSTCHEAPKEGIVYSRFDHTASFASQHRYEAYQGAKLCAMCHAQSFCNDCHVTTVELKPSVKNSTDSYRMLPHRGDYISRHQIDGRVDPTSCFRCHGNPKSSKTCVKCHGK